MNQDRIPGNNSKVDLSRRDFIAGSLAVGLSSLTSSSSGFSWSLKESELNVETPDGTCDAAFFYPEPGVYPGVLLWHDSLGRRPAIHELGRKLAAHGYSVLVPNAFYREAKYPVFDEKFDFVKNLSDREKYHQVTASLFSPGAVERDAMAYVDFLDHQPQVNIMKGIGTHGYCLGGPFVIKTCAVRPERVRAGASFHGGFLVTDKPESPHLLAPKIKSRLYFAIASDDDQQEPHVKDKLREAFSRARVQAEIELYPQALHGWCVPDSANARNKADSDKAWGKLLSLYNEAL